MSLNLKNFNIRQFNQDVNRSQDPDEKHLHWAVYRQQISTLFSGTWRSSIVLGAGALNDVDLASLCSLSDCVFLADIDTDTVLQGIERQGLPPVLRKKIEVVRHDFSGAHNARLFERLVAVVQRQAPVAMVIATLAEILADMKPVTLLPGQSFDLVFSCPVYTQLVYTQIEVLLKILHAAGLYAYDELNRILVAAHHGMQSVLHNYNDMMLSLQGVDGRIIVLADVLELQADDPLLAVLTAEFAQNHVDNARIRSLLDEHGLELALTGLTDLEARLDAPETGYFLWPFDASKSYVVQSLTGCRKNGIWQKTDR